MQDTSAEQMTAPKPPVCWCQGASLQAQLAQMNPKLTQVNPKLSSPQQSSVGPGPCPWSQGALRQRWTEGQTYPSSSLGLHRARTQLGQTCTSPGRKKPGVSPCKPNAGVTETREPRKHTLGDGTDLVQPRASLQSDKDHLFTERAKSLLVQQPVGLAYL